MAGIKRPRPLDDDERGAESCLTNYGHIQNQATVQQIQGSIYNGPVYATYTPDDSFFTQQKIIRRHTKGENRQRLLKFLHFGQIGAHRRNLKAAYSKTCRWLLDKLEYQQWLDDKLFQFHHGILWIKGKPGTGKSTIIEFTYFHMKSEFPHVHVISFFFTARGSLLERSTSGMYRSLLLQLLKKLHDLQSVLDSFWDPSMDQTDELTPYEWATDILQDILRDAIKRLDKREVFCFIDALDECDEKQVRQMVQFFEEIGQLATDTGIKFRTFFSSRHYPHISIDRCNTIILEDQEGHHQDITTYLAGKLKIGSTTQAQIVRQNVVTRASGVFLWVVLVTEMLNTEYDRGQVHSLGQRLDDIQDDLEALFHDILTRDGKPNHDLVLCLQFVLFAQRPLQPQELYSAVLTVKSGPDADIYNSAKFQVSQDDMRRFILHSSKGLVDITKGPMPIVQCIHESVRNFFLNASDLQTKLFGPPETLAARSHDHLASCCHMYYVKAEAILQAKSAASDPDSKNELNTSLDHAAILPFFEYSVENIFHHCDKAQGLGISQVSLLDNLNIAKYITCFNFVQGRRTVRSRPLELHRDSLYPENISRLTIFAESNLRNLISLELASKPLIDTFDEIHGHPIFAAHRKGNKDALKALLLPSDLISGVQSRRESSAMIIDDNLEKAIDELLAANRDYTGHTTLSWATVNGMHAVIKCLLAGGKVDANRTVRDDIIQVLQMYESSSQKWTAQAQHERVRSFLERNEVRLHGHFFRVARTPLHLAVRHAQPVLVQLILEYDSTDVNKNDGTGNTALHYAAQVGHQQIVRLLLGHRHINVNQQNPWTLTTALHEAAQYGDIGTVKLLLARDETQVNVPQRLGMTPLHLAAAGGSHGYTEVVRLLLTRPDIEIDRLDVYKRTPLDYASKNGRASIMTLLLGYFGFDTNDMTPKGDTTPLHRAIQLGSVETTEFLLRDQNVQVNQLNCDGFTPLHLAVRLERVDIVGLLVQHKGVVLDQPDASGQTALVLAIQNGFAEIAVMLSTAVHPTSHRFLVVPPDLTTSHSSRSMPQARPHFSDHAADATIASGTPRSLSPGAESAQRVLNDPDKA